MPTYPGTPDGRYFVVKGQLWRCSNPSLPEELRQQLVSELMSARREVRQAKSAEDDSRLKLARARVQASKVALGERGPVWTTRLTMARTGLTASMCTSALAQVWGNCTLT
ncbi:hypothetical protein AABC73_17080 [Pseudomonas sp. G.S.17]|uniref:hypothetical protein n=1 Tax=Pseudomonas sp. G.S.17 TaxID=3137451 RepID=UPI00311CCB3F